METSVCPVNKSEQLVPMKNWSNLMGPKRVYTHLKAEEWVTKSREQRVSETW